MNAAEVKTKVFSEKGLIASGLIVFFWQFFHLVSQMRRASAGLIPIPRDQSLYIQIFENMLHFRGTGASILGMESMLSNHFSPVFFLLMPVYGIIRMFFSIPDAIFFLTFLILFSGSLALFVYANHVSKKNILILISLAVMWTGSSNLNYLSSGGFRETFIAFIPLTLMIHSFHTQNKKIFIISSLLLMSVREDYGLILFGFSLLSYGRKGYFWKVFPVLGLFVFFFLMVAVIPYFNPAGSFTGAGRYSHLGNSFSEIVLSPFNKPHVFIKALFSINNLGFLADLIYPFCFLPLFAPRIIIPFIPYLFVLLLNNDPVVPTSSIFTWYAAPAAPFALAASVHVLGKLDDRFHDRKFYPFILMALPVLFFFNKSSLFSTLYFPEPAANYNESIKNVKAMLPEKASVTASYNLSPFFADRENLKYYTYNHDPEINFYTVISTDYSNPATWQDCCSLEDYAGRIQKIKLNYKKQIIYEDKNMFLISPESLKTELIIPEFQYSQWEEAEYAGSEYFYNISLLGHKGISARSLSGVLPGITGRRSAGNALVGGIRRGRGEWEFTLRIKGNIPLSCSKDRMPEFLIRDTQNILYRENFPVYVSDEYRDIKFKFRIAEDQSFFPVIRYRRCGNGWMDKYRLKNISD